MPNTYAAIIIAAKHSELIKVKDASGVTNTIGALRCKFEFRTAEWDKSARTAVFCKGNMSTHPGIVENAISVPLDSVDECAVPAEVLVPDAKYFSVGIWGVTNDGLRIVSKWLVFRIEDGCYVDSTEPIKPTPTIYEQIMLSLNSKAPVDHKHDDIYYTKEEINEIIEENSSGGSTGGVIVEADPTVPDWAKQPHKPSYTAEEVGALPNTTKIPTTTEDLINNSEFITKSEVAADLNEYVKKDEVLQPDWNQTDETKADFIKNKPIKEITYPCHIADLDEGIYLVKGSLSDGNGKVTFENFTLEGEIKENYSYIADGTLTILNKTVYDEVDYTEAFINFTATGIIHTPNRTVKDETTDENGNIVIISNTTALENTNTVNGVLLQAFKLKTIDENNHIDWVKVDTWYSLCPYMFSDIPVDALTERITEKSTRFEVPTAKAVYDYVKLENLNPAWDTTLVFDGGNADVQLAVLDKTILL